MSERPRNIIIGLTFIAALGIAMVGIVLLGKFPSLGGIHQYTVLLVTNNANGVAAGSKIEFNGVYAGTVESTWLDADEKGNALVIVKMKIDPTIKLPKNINASLQRPAAVGNPFVSLTATEFKAPFLADGDKIITTVNAGDSGLIPQSVFADIHELKESLMLLSGNLNTVTRDLHVLLAYTPPEALDNVDPKDPNAPKANASTMIIRLDRTVSSLQNLLTDPKLQGQVRDIVQNIADASSKLKTTMGKFDETLGNANTTLTTANNTLSAFGNTATKANATLETTQKDIDKVAQKLVETLAQLDTSIKTITSGQGTTGKLVNDPRLYDGLVDLSKSLKSTVDDLDFLLNKWKDEGVNLKLK